MPRPILCLDFDGVCHSYTSGWQGPDKIPDPPVVGLEPFIQAALSVFEVHIVSSRMSQLNGRQAIMDWFREVVGLPTMLQLHFSVEKPAALVSLDDRCLLFTGQWPSIQELLNFQPWYKRGTS